MVDLYIRIQTSEVGGVSNREVDFGFGSCVRVRVLDVEWMWAQKGSRPFSLFAFVPVFFPFPLVPK